MRSLATLLKVAQRELEMLRRGLNDALARLAGIEANIAALDASLAEEAGRAAGDALATLGYAAYAARRKADRQTLCAQALCAEAECERLRALIAEAHVETRKFERLLELEAERTRKAADKRADAELDEMATMRAGRARV